MTLVREHRLRPTDARELVDHVRRTGELPPEPMGCAARQYSDTMVCHECRLRWDTNDSDPPRCGREPPRIEERPWFGWAMIALVAAGVLIPAAVFVLWLAGQVR